MKTIPTTYSRKESAAIDSFEKGELFERFIIELFNKEKFILSKWRTSKRLEDKFQLLDCARPDLELIFRRNRQYHFAVECKWRQKFVEGKIQWATRKQICSYQNFENQHRMPVFIAIGIGGEPSKPERLYVTPLRNIEMYTEVYESNLIPYKRKTTSHFFYDTIQFKLF